MLKAFNLIIDEDRSKIMTGLLVASQSDPKFRPFIIQHNLSDTYNTFIEEFGDKVHELNWCKDPTCDEKK